MISRSKCRPSNSPSPPLALLISDHPIFEQHNVTDSDHLFAPEPWTLGISKPSATEKWNAFEEDARELYPSGPDGGELWSRAGGNNFDLPGQPQDGATRWHTTLKSVRHGGGPTARALLSVMCRDFPQNERLRMYANDTDIVGWR
ncbi:effector-associated domain EAD1-containing protein (plasmid) [Robbsia andropogonis]|uniref:effector-associated domain EAD1-containing protein n=1 Tax=Robbsia andropogonis TaxID=28092 RepID=UPI003D1D7D22